MHIPSLVKIHWCLLKLSSGNENLGVSGQITPSKIDEICPLAIPSQISTISMHIPSLVKIHWCLLKLSSWNEKRMDGPTGGQTDGRTDGLTDDQRETIIPHHYCVGGYKKNRYKDTEEKNKYGVTQKGRNHGTQPSQGIALWKHAYTNIYISSPKTENFQLKKLWYFFSYFCSKHILWVLVWTASMRRF